MLPQVIVITGSSGSGKTSLASALQEALLPSIWLNFSFDTIIYSLPDSVLERCNLHNDWTGVDGVALYGGALSCLRSLVKNGNRVIFDAVLSRQQEVDRLVNELHDVEVRSIHLYCDWEEIERRTMSRGDRTLAEAERSFARTMQFSNDSILLDTTNQKIGTGMDGLIAKMKRESKAEMATPRKPSDQFGS